MTVCYARWNETPPCVQDSHPYRITSTKRRINTVVSPDDGPIEARITWKLTNINILRKKVVHQVGLLTRQSMHLCCPTYVPHFLLISFLYFINWITFGVYRGADKFLAQEGNNLQRQKILSFIFPIYNHYWRNNITIYIYIYIYIYI